MAMRRMKPIRTRPAKEGMSREFWWAMGTAAVTSVVVAIMVSVVVIMVSGCTLHLHWHASPAPAKVIVTTSQPADPNEAWEESSGGMFEENER